MNGLDLSTGFVLVMLLLAASEPVSRWTRLPRPTVQMILGAIAATALVSAGFDTGLRYQNFHDLVIYACLPALIFEAAYAIDLGALRRLLLPIMTLAVLGLVATCGFVAIGVFLGIDHAGFPWPAALLTGILLAATDPAAVTGQLSGGSRLAVLLEGESLFNDVTAVVLFTLILGIAATTGPADVSTAGMVSAGAIRFVTEFSGGALLGAGAGLLALTAARGLAEGTARYWLALAAAYGSYLAAHAVDCSGAMAVLVAGLIVGYRADTSPTEWRSMAHTSTGVLFLLMGATLQLNMFQQRWLAMLIAIAAVFLARAMVLQITLAATNLFYNDASVHGSGDRFTLRERFAAGALGMRGAITVALALTLPTDLPYWWTIQSIAYGVVFFDMCVTAPLAPSIIRSARPRTA